MGFNVFFYDVYIIKSIKSGIFDFEVNKMVLSEEFFSCFWKFVFIVDKEISELKDSLENFEIFFYNENCVCLLLREIFVEIKDLKVRNNFSFGSFLNKNLEENFMW